MNFKSWISFVKVISSAILLFVAAPVAMAFQSSQSFNLKKGPYAAGFTHFIQYDHSRTFDARLNNEGYPVENDISRPIYTGIWYPAVQSPDDKKMLYSEYVNLMKIEKQFTDAQIRVFIDSAKYENEMHAVTNAIRDAAPAEGKFPVLIYAPSYNAPSFENSVMFEYLASHGYIVVSSPSIGADDHFISTQFKGLEAQTRDIEFLIGSMIEHEGADIDKLAVIGFSWGGISNVAAALRNKRIKALVALDGSIMYYPEKFEKLTHRNIDSYTIPSLFMAQEAMKTDTVFKGFDYNTFPFYDSLRYSDAYYLKFTQLVHQNFGSHFIRLKSRDNNPKENNQETVNKNYEIISSYVKNFLDAYLLDNDSAYQYLQNKPIQNGHPDKWVKVRRKKALPIPSKMTEIKLPVEKMHAYTGTFKVGTSSVMEILLEGNRLFMHSSNSPSMIEIFPTSETHFITKVGDGNLEFSNLEKSKYQKVTITFRSPREAKRIK